MDWGWVPPGACLCGGWGPTPAVQEYTVLEAVAAGASEIRALLFLEVRAGPRLHNTTEFPPYPFTIEHPYPESAHQDKNVHQSLQSSVRERGFCAEGVCGEGGQSFGGQNWQPGGTQDGEKRASQWRYKEGSTD